MELSCNKAKSNIDIRQYMLANKNPNTRNGLPLFELLASGIPKTSKHNRILPLLLVTFKNFMAILLLKTLYM